MAEVHLEGCDPGQNCVECYGPPPIPATCEHRPTAGGYVLPWLNVQLADGGVDFRRQHTTRLAQCLYNGWCQLCARPMRSPMVLFGTQRVFEHLFFDEPALHPECGLYALRACPMLRGDRTEYARGPSVAQGRRGATCPTPGCDCGGWVNHGDPQRTDYAAKPWFMVWASDYAMSVDEQGGPTGAVLTPTQVLKVMRVSRPGLGRCWERVPLAEALAGYTPINAMVHIRGGIPDDHTPQAAAAAGPDVVARPRAAAAGRGGAGRDAVRRRRRKRR